MNKFVVGLVLVLALLAGSFAYVSYSLATSNGELSTQLKTATDANAEWDKVYKATVSALNDRQSRLDKALAQDAKNMQDAAKNSSLFRKEIDSLKEQNRAYKDQLEARLPDPILIRLCERGYASADVCAGVLPNSRQLHR